MTAAPWAYQQPVASTVPGALAARSERRDKEFELWQRWKHGETSVLGELFQSLAPLIRKISMAYQGNLPAAYIEAETKKNVLRALETYDPSYLGPTGQPIQLSTHITNQCRKVLREIYKYQNPTRLAEETHLKVPTYTNVRQNLANLLGRDPTHLEMAREMNIGVGEARRLETGARRDLSAVEGQLLWHQDPLLREQEILDHVYYELTSQEQQCLEFVFGRNGKPVLSATEIATKLGLSTARISQIKKRIADVIQQHYGGQKPAPLY